MGFHKVHPGIEEIFIVVVKDQNGNEIEKWTSLKRDFYKVVKILDEKFSLNVYKKKTVRDLDWALD